VITGVDSDLRSDRGGTPRLPRTWRTPDGRPQCERGRPSPAIESGMPAAVELPTIVPEYFPPAVGRYEVKPGLVRFGKPLGGGVADGHVFQFDATFPRFRRAKLDARRERLGKYFVTDQFHPPVAAAVAEFIVRRLVLEHPDHFAFDEDDRARSLACRLTGDRLHFDGGWELRDVDAGPAGVDPPYASALDALASQVQEDLAVVSTDGPRHWLGALHVCIPNFWAAEDKVGRPFAVVHEPVAGMEQMNRRADEMVRLMVNARDGLVRFAWGITWDDELNHHPVLPPGAVRSPRFDPGRPSAFVRVERQTMWGFPEIGAALFTIRPYLLDCAALRRDPARTAQLAAALRSMTPESLAYKGLADSRDALVRWLEAPL
ncbi:MAG: hypothetical protein AVDCRST_MAG64-1012, partial [uncultured Phycisphaerae bacterium]